MVNKARYNPWHLAGYTEAIPYRSLDVSGVSYGGSLEDQVFLLKAKSMLDSKQEYERNTETEQSPRGGRRGGKQRETTSLQNPAHQERI